MKTAVKEKPILFNGEMVRAVLEGRKTQTRRVIKPQPENTPEPCCYSETGWAESSDDGGCECSGKPVRCPYGHPGDRIWVRENFKEIPESRPSGYWTNPELIGKDFWYQATDNLPTWGEGRWKPSIHMPRVASRINLEVTKVRVERVQDISEEDALADGGWEYGGCPIHKCPEFSFQELWNSINKKRGFGWSVNPWVWVVEFKLLNSE